MPNSVHSPMMSIEKGDVELGSSFSGSHTSQYTTQRTTQQGFQDIDDITLQEMKSACSPEYEWNSASIIRQRVARGIGENCYTGFNTIRYPRQNYWFAQTYSLVIRDWFHSLLEMATYKIFMFFIAYYVLMIFLFSLLWLWAGSDGDPCMTGITNLTDAFYFSLITFTTIGYGSASTFFNSCSSVTVIIFFESFMGVVFNAVILGVLFGKLQRGATRGTSIAYSKKALIRVINDKLYFEFRVCEQRKLQIVEAHVRCYAICHQKQGSHQRLHLFQQYPMRLNQPSDELGGMLLLMLPSNVVHRIDPWSPLFPPSCQPKTLAGDRSSMSSYAYPEILLRQGDTDQGGATWVECAISGEGFCTEHAHKLHHERENLPYPCSSSVIEPSVEDVLHKMQDYFIRSEMEILVVIEGIDPTMSATLQSCYTYKSDDIVWNTHEFVPCTVREGSKPSGKVVIDFEKFHQVEPSYVSPR